MTLRVNVCSVCLQQIDPNWTSCLALHGQMVALEVPLTDDYVRALVDDQARRDAAR